jgi:transcriptional regulator with XRE-family HTH domain
MTVEFESLEEMRQWVCMIKNMEYRKPVSESENKTGPHEVPEGKYRGEKWSELPDDVLKASLLPGHPSFTREHRDEIRKEYERRLRDGESIKHIYQVMDNEGNVVLSGKIPSGRQDKEKKPPRKPGKKKQKAEPVVPDFSACKDLRKCLSLLFKSGWSQDRIAKKTNVSQGVISRFMCDSNAGISSTTAERLSKAFKIPENICKRAITKRHSRTEKSPDTPPKQKAKQKPVPSHEDLSWIEERKRLNHQRLTRETGRGE